MKVEYLDDISDGGRYTEIDINQLVRIYGFDESEAKAFQDAIQQTIVNDKKSLDLGHLNFVEAVNCHLILRISESNIGLTTINKKDFYCDLTIHEYANMILLIEPFCSKDTNGYQWLYDLLNDIDFLFSPDGSW